MLLVAGAVPDPADQEQILAAISADLAFVAAREPQSLRGGIARDFLARRRATPGAFALPEPRYPCSAEAEAALATAESLARAAPRDADDAYARALSLCPTNALGWTWYGDLYFAQANYQRATELYSRGLRVDPLLATAYRYRADAAAALGQPEAARLDLLRAIAADPTYEAAWGALGSLQGARGGQLHRPTPPPVRYDPQSGELLVDQVGEQALPAGDLAASYVFAVVDAGRPPAGMSLPPGLPGPDRPAIERRRAALRAARPSRPARRGVRRVCGRNLSVITHRSFVPGIYFYRITFRGAKFFRASHKLSVTLEPLNKTIMGTLSAKDLDLATRISVNVPSFQVFALVLQLLAPREADGNLEE
jgi:tetratricopeptide (TPR) repeat protein